jgi:hypothetical protein
MATIASDTTLCGPLFMPETIPGANTTYDWCATPNVGNTTLQIMQYCCGSWNEVHNTDGCTWCYHSDQNAENSTTFNINFSNCLSEQAAALNATRQRITHCNTPSKSSGAVTKGVSVWKVGAMVVLLGVVRAL